MASEATGNGSKKTGKGILVFMEENVTKRQLSSAVAHANKIGKLLDKRFSFDIDSKTNKVIVKIVDKSTGNVVRVVPPGEMVRMAAHLKQLKVLSDKVIGAAESVILDS